MSDPNFDGMEEVKSRIIKLGKPGNWIKATIVDNTQFRENSLSQKTPKEQQQILELKIHGGQFNNIVDKVPVEEVTELVKGDFWTFYAKPGVQSQIRNAKIGQIIGISFVEERAPKNPGYNPTKIIKVYLGEMDPEYKGEQKGDETPNPF